MPSVFVFDQQHFHTGFHLSGTPRLRRIFLFSMQKPPITINLDRKAGQPVRLLSISCLSYNKGSNWLTNASLGFYVRNKDCQPSLMQRSI